MAQKLNKQALLVILGLTQIVLALGLIIWLVLPWFNLEADYYRRSDKPLDLAEQVFEAQEPSDQWLLYIPKLKLTAPIVTNVNPWQESQYNLALESGVAHAYGSSLPGEAGTSFIFAHSSNFDWRLETNPEFYLLYKLEPGDLIYVWNPIQDKQLKFEVETEMVVSPDKIEYIGQYSDRAKLTLMTCWPVGTNWRRLLINSALDET